MRAGKKKPAPASEPSELPLAKSALIAIDVQNDFLDLSPDCKAIVKPLTGLMQAFRDRHLPVIHTLYYHGQLRYPGVNESRYCVRGTEGAREPKELRHDFDTYQEKPGFNAFYKTELDHKLRQHDIETLVIAGLVTDYCVWATALTALEHNYNVVLVKDCCASDSRGLHRSLLKRFSADRMGEILSSTELAKRLERHHIMHRLEGIEWL